MKPTTLVENSVVYVYIIIKTIARLLIYGELMLAWILGFVLLEAEVCAARLRRQQARIRLLT